MGYTKSESEKGLQFRHNYTNDFQEEMHTYEGRSICNENSQVNP